MASRTCTVYCLFYMANIESQKKRISRSQREHLENKRVTSVVKTHFRSLEEAANEGNAEKASEIHRLLVAKIDKAAKIDAFHKKNAARKKSRASRILASCK